MASAIKDVEEELKSKSKKNRRTSSGTKNG